MEHLHTLPQPWTVADECKRAQTWRDLGADDVLEVSVPWSMAPGVTVTDAKETAGVFDDNCPVLVREYTTPAGVLRHAVRHTQEKLADGWVVQPDHVPLIEDMNIPRAVEHAVSTPEDIERLQYLYVAPDDKACTWFHNRMAALKQVAEHDGFPVQAWAGFGMDAVVWFAGTDGAILMAMDAPDAFADLMNLITDVDAARVRLAAQSDAVDMIVARGWYSSTDFWSPSLFDRYVFPYIERLARLAHEHGKLFAYTMTTGVEILGPRLVEAGVDVLYFVDPLQDTISLERAAELFGDRLTLVGGINSLMLQCGNNDRIRDGVRQAISTLGRGAGRFVLHPVDALFPDTPWQGVEHLIAAWKECQ